MTHHMHRINTRQSVEIHPLTTAQATRESIDWEATAEMWKQWRASSPTSTPYATSVARTSHTPGSEGDNR